MVDACEEGRIEEVREIMKSHPDTIYWEIPERVCLFLFVCLFVFFLLIFEAASRFGHVGVVKELLKRKANIEAPFQVRGIFVFVLF